MAECDPKTEVFQRPPRGWGKRFHGAGQGVAKATHGQASFLVHGFAACLVVALGWGLRIDTVAWCLVILCITVVLTAETFNSALEQLAQAIDRRYRPEIADALDMASGAVLWSAIGAALVGCIILGPPLVEAMLGLFAGG